MNTNNAINNGMTSKLSDFQWFKPTADLHVDGVTTSAPDFTIPPTPASSYANLHVVLDSVHPSTETITRGVISAHSHFDASSFISWDKGHAVESPIEPSLPAMMPASVPMSVHSTSASMPTSFENKNFMLNKIPDIRDVSLRAIPEKVDPEQPGARASESLTSLKSEISPIDFLAERTDRALPEAVDLTLYDETAAATPKKQVQPSWIDQLESAERRWRMSRGIDALWSGRVHLVGIELMNSLTPIGWSQWFMNLKNKAVAIENKVVEKSIDLLDSAVDTVRDLSVSLTPEKVEAKHAIWQPKLSTSDSEPYVVSLPRLVPSSVLSAQEAERADRMARGVDVVLSGKWSQIGRELKHSVGDDIAAWFSGFKNRIAHKGQNLMESAVDTLISMNATKAPISSAVPHGLSYNYEPIDFTFKSRRVPYSIIRLEEAERASRMQRGISPIISGRWAQIGLELKHKFSMRPTLASTASQVAGVASDLASMAGVMLGNLAERAIESGKDMIAQATPVPEVNFVEQEHPSNLFAYSAEPIDFTFKSRRCPAWIIAQEEKERADRVSQGVDVLAYGRWNSLLSEPHKTLAAELPSISYLASAKEALVESSKGFSGYFSNLAHSVADRVYNATAHNHYVEAAKDSIVGMYDHSSIAAITKAEEVERLRRIDAKVDPMLAARLGRVQDELLHTVKSV